MRSIYSLRSRAAQLLRKNPIDVIQNGQLILQERIRSDTEHIEKVQEEIFHLTDALKQAKGAEEWMRNLDSSQLEYYRIPQNWQKEPHLQYIWKMTGLF